MTRVLIVDDDRAMCEAVASSLRGENVDADWLTSAEKALARIDSEDFDAVVTDLNMKGMNGVELCHRLVDNRPDLPVIVITAFGSLETAIATIRAGAFDFLTKPFEIDDLLVSLARATQARSLRKEVHRLHALLAESRGLSDLIGSSDAIRRVSELIDQVARSDVGVLITGESGTGKELVARAIHRHGERPRGPFVAINCAAIPETLFESELFGHAKGAFTDARTARRGLLQEAEGGTVFLDEVGDMPLAMQAKLLRVLEDHKIRPVGGNVEVSFDARVIAATNRDLEAAVADKTFREDLYYRLHVVHFEVPPLRARGGDILLLAQHFVERAAERTSKPVKGITSAAAQRLLDYTWPGNVRELLNAMERAVALTKFEELTVDDLPERIRSYKSIPIVVAASSDELVPLAELERRYTVRVLEAVGGNKAAAARVLGLDRTTLYRMLDRFGLR